MIERTEFESGTFYLGDCFEVMAELEAGSIDMVLADLPYGTTTYLNSQGVTTASWDNILPFPKLWEKYERLLSTTSSIILTSAQPFTSALISSNLEDFKYTLVWEKSRPGGFFDVKYRPLRSHEDICVFTKAGVATNSKIPVRYNPQGVTKINPKPRKPKGVSSNIRTVTAAKGEQTLTNYPRSVLKFDSETKTIHPTQKPVALFEYLIRTYTNEGQTVLDNTAGSGTTAIAAMNAGRRWICIEKDETYYRAAVERVRKHEEKMKESA